MPRILGLDVGTNSIGWALIDPETEKLIDAGVRIFPEGVDRTQQGTEQSKNMGRRTARGMRRQAARRARRKKRLEAFLPQHGLWISTKAERDQLVATDPYALRKKGLDEQLSLHEFGRTLVHMNRRRGFRSNRKTDRAKKKEDEGMLAEISALEATIQSSGCRTLGEYLCGIANPDRIRGRHTRRDMYEREFDLLWETQQQFHSEVLTDELKKQVRDQLFFQRKMYWKPGSIGKCSVTSEPRASLSDRAAQRFRMLQEVNNLEVLQPDGELRPLTEVERGKLLDYLGDSDKREFEAIRKHLKLTNCYFNLERGERDSMKGMPVDKSMQSLFGKKVWEAKDESEKTAIVRELIQFADHGEEKDEAPLRERAVKEWHLPEEKAEKMLNFDPKGRASFSITALDKLLPHLEQGLPLMTDENKPCALSAAGFLKPHERVVNQRDGLPQPPSDITNPIVKQALHEVRRLVNAVIKTYGKPDAIHIELARETRGGLKQREEFTKKIHQRRRQRESAATEIKSLNETSERQPTRAEIERVLLWKEQGERCIYSGKPISLAQLVSGEVNVDHVWPYARCLDDSRGNKVLCFRDMNAEKANMSPYEWLHREPDRYDAVLQRVGGLPYEVRYGKMQRFQTKELVLDNFINRQLTDTSYICRQIREYVRCLGTDVVCTRGDLTAEIRHQWGLNAILASPDAPDKKSRDDHRHHAVDAIVIALTSRSLLQKLSKRKRDFQLPDPWATFRADVETKIRSIWVSFRIRKRVRGRLHEETHYGRTDKPERSLGDGRPWARDWVESKTKFVVKVPLARLTPSMVDDIRDTRVKEIVVARLKERGIDPGTVKKIDPSVWAEPLLLAPRRGKSKNPEIIKAVRVLKEDATIQPIRDGSVCVKPGSTHHICIFERKDAKGKRYRELISVTLLAAYQRKKAGQPIIKRTHSEDSGARFIMSLAKGETILAEVDGHEKLLRYITSASTTEQMAFRDHTDARPGATFEKITKKPSTLKARKVVVDVLGRIRPASD